MSGVEWREVGSGGQRREAARKTVVMTGELKRILFDESEASRRPLGDQEETRKRPVKGGLIEKSHSYAGDFCKSRRHSIH